MVRLTKLTPLGQSSWGPHSLSSPIQKPIVEPLPEFPRMRRIGDEIPTPRTMKKLNPLSLSRAERARQSPFLKHLSKRDREEKLIKLGAVKKPTGEYRLENKLSTLLRTQIPSTANGQRDTNRKKPLKQTKKCIVKEQSSSLQSSCGDWWRSSDYENFNYPNPNGGDDGSHQVNSRSFYYSGNIDEFVDQENQETDIQFVDQGKNLNVNASGQAGGAETVYYFYDLEPEASEAEVEADGTISNNDSNESMIEEDDASSVGSNLYEDELVSSRELNSNSIRAAALEGAVVSSTGPDSITYTDGMIMEMNA